MNEEQPVNGNEISVQKRPDNLSGTTYKVITGCGTCYITINNLNSKPFELFVHFGKSGGCTQTMLGALAISISHGLRAGISIEEFIQSLEFVHCPKTITGVANKGQPILSCIDALAKIMKKHAENLIEKNQTEGMEKDEKPDDLPSCPMCKGSLVLYDAVDEPYDLQCSSCNRKFKSSDWKKVVNHE